MNFDELFDLCDKNSNGNIDLEEFRIFLLQMGLLTSDEQALFLFEGADVDKSHSLSKEELRKLVDIIKSEDKLELNKIFFRAIDKDCNGLINQFEFPILLRLNNKYYPKHELRYHFMKMTQGDKYARFDQCMKFILGIDTKERAYPKDYQPPEDIANFNKLYDSIDTDHNESLSFDQFKEFIYIYMNQLPLTETQVEAWFNGTDYERTGKIKKIDLLALCDMIKHDAKEPLVYLYFRGCDENRDAYLTANEYIDFLLLNGIKLPKDEKAQVKRCLRIDFTTAFKKVTGKEPIQPDPYERMRKHKGNYQKFNALWSSLDTTHAGCLTFNEFKEFLMTMVDDPMNEEELELWFRGSDINNNGTIDKGELWHLTKAIWMNEVVVLSEILFRGIDTDNNGAVDFDELSTLFEIQGYDYEDDEIKQMMAKEAPGKSQLTFPEFLHLSTGITLDPKKDIYADRKRKNGFSGRFDKLWREFDKDESHGLSFDEFKGFILALSQKPMTEEQARLFYNGIDVEDVGFATKAQCRLLERAICQENELELNKIMFRGADTDRSNKIELNEFINLARINGQPLSEEQAQEIIRTLSNGKTSITFPQFYRYITGASIPDDTEAYTPKQLKALQQNQQKNDKFDKIWDEIDTEHLGYLDFDGFKTFLVQWGYQDSREIVYEYMFHGSDINNNAEISKTEMRTLLKAAMNKDMQFLGKLFFRAADANYDSQIDTQEYIDVMRVFGKKIDQETAIVDFQKVGAEEALTYPQFVKLVFKKDVPEDEDPYDGNRDKMLSEFNTIFNQFDKDGSGKIEYDEFKDFLVEFVAYDMTELQCECYFNGSDIEHNGTVSWRELYRLAKALRRNDLITLNKIYFRGMNKKSADSIDLQEFRTLADLNQNHLSKQDAAIAIAEISGGKDHLTFMQAMNYLTGMQLTDEIDPYDGRTRSGKPQSRFDKVLAELCPNNDGIDQETFVWAILDLAPNRLTDEQSEIIFKGADVNNDSKITKIEFYDVYQAFSENDTQQINQIAFNCVQKTNMTKEEKLAFFYRLNNFVKKKAEVQQDAQNVPNKFDFPSVYEHVTGNTYKDKSSKTRSKSSSGGCNCSCNCCHRAAKVEAEPLLEDNDIPSGPQARQRQRVKPSNSPIQVALRWIEIIVSILGFISLLLVFVADLLSYNHYHLVNGQIQRGVSPSEWSPEYHPYLQEKQYGIGIMVISFCSCIIEIVVAMLLVFGQEGTMIYRFIGGPLIRGIVYIFLGVAFMGFNLKFSLASSILTIITGVGHMIVGIIKAAQQPKPVR